MAVRVTPVGAHRAGRERGYLLLPAAVEVICSRLIDYLLATQVMCIHLSVCLSVMPVCMFIDGHLYIDLYQQNRAEQNRSDQVRAPRWQGQHQPDR